MVPKSGCSISAASPASKMASSVTNSRMAVGEDAGAPDAGVGELGLDLVGLAVGEGRREHRGEGVVAIGQLDPEGRGERGALLVVGRGEEHPTVAGLVEPVQRIEAEQLGVGLCDGRLAVVGDGVVGVGVDVAADHRGRQELADAGAPLMEQAEHRARCTRSAPRSSRRRPAPASAARSPLATRRR